MPHQIIHVRMGLEVRILLRPKYPSMCLSMMSINTLETMTSKADRGFGIVELSIYNMLKGHFINMLDVSCYLL